MTDPISINLRLQAAALRRSLMPPYILLPPRPSDEEMARRAAQQEADRAAVQAYGVRRLVAATDAWTDLRNGLPEGAAGNALRNVLALHKPHLTGWGYHQEVPRCQDCTTDDYEHEFVDWPCETYEAIREGLEGEQPDDSDWACPGCGKTWGEIPVGHSWGLGFNPKTGERGEYTCSDPGPPVDPAEMAKFGFGRKP